MSDSAAHGAEMDDARFNGRSISRVGFPLRRGPGFLYNSWDFRIASGPSL